MPGNYAALRTELLRSDLADLDDDAATDLLNTPGDLAPQPVPMLTVLQWAAGNGLRAGIETASKYDGADPQALLIKSLCLGWIDMMWGVGVAHVFDVTDPHLLPMLGAFVAAGLMTDDQRTELIYLAAEPAPSRAASIPGWDLPVTPIDVAFARSM